jgi:microcystin-dependent protein
MPTPDFSKIWASASPLPEFTFTDSEYTEGWDFVGSAPPTKNQFDAWFKMVDEKLNWLYNQMQETASKLYPVGSVYISFNSADPSTLFGGTWERLKDTFLLANGDSYAPNTTGGSATKNITVDNLPSHSHTISWDGNHSHTKGSMNITGWFGADDRMTHAYGGAFYDGGWGYDTGSERSETGNIFRFDASRAWTGKTSLNGNHSHAIGSTGSNLPLNIMPPYKTVYMWRRTA